MYTKTITPHFETEGRRRRLVGYLAELHGGEMLLHSQIYSTQSQAEQALDALVYELLTDLHEQELVDDVPAALADAGVTSQQIPSWLAEAQAKTAHCSEDCPCDNPNHNHTGYRTPDPRRRNLAINRVIVGTHKLLHIPCKLCQGDHLTQRCPQIAARLFAFALCRECGDPLPIGDGDTCQACREWEPVVMVVDVEHAPQPWAA